MNTWVQNKLDAITDCRIMLNEIERNGGAHTKAEKNFRDKIIAERNELELDLEEAGYDAEGERL
jgi:hypothetical protein